MGVASLSKEWMCERKIELFENRYFLRMLGPFISRLHKKNWWISSDNDYHHHLCLSTKDLDVRADVRAPSQKVKALHIAVTTSPKGWMYEQMLELLRKWMPWDHEYRESVQAVDLQANVGVCPESQSYQAHELCESVQNVDVRANGHKVGLLQKTEAIEFMSTEFDQERT